MRLFVFRHRYLRWVIIRTRIVIITAPVAFSSGTAFFEPLVPDRDTVAFARPTATSLTCRAPVALFRRARSQRAFGRMYEHE